MSKTRTLLAGVLSLGLSPGSQAADRGTACPTSLPLTLKADSFDDQFAMCSAYGNWSPQTRTSVAGADKASVVLSTDYTEEGVRKHVLVIGLQLSNPCATCTGTAHIYVYRHAEGLWTKEKYRTAAAAGGGLGAAPLAALVRMGPERLGVKISGHSAQAGSTIDTDVFIGLYGEGLHAITPVFGGRTNRLCTEGSTTGCDERSYSFAFVAGSDPVWNDLVVTEVWRRREQGRHDIVPIDHETRFVYRGAAYAQVAPPSELGALTRWTGRVGEASMNLALIQSPTRVVGTFRHAQGSGFLRGDAAGHLVDEMRAGTWTGTFAGRIDPNAFAGSWRSPNGRAEVPFSFTRTSPAQGELAGAYAATDAHITLGVPVAGPDGKETVEVTGQSLWGGSTLSGSHTFDGEVIRYDDGKCKLVLYRSADVLVVQQLTERCGPAGTFDSLDVGPYFQK